MGDKIPARAEAFWLEIVKLNEHSHSSSIIIFWNVILLLTLSFLIFFAVITLTDVVWIAACPGCIQSKLEGPGIWM